VFPHDTDYAGIVWHGSYVRWMEEARVAWLNSVGIAFSDLVALGFDLPVVDISIRYRRSLRMGDRGQLKARPLPQQGARLPWEYELWSRDRDSAAEDPGAKDKKEKLHLTAQVTLVAVNRSTGKILRQLPPALADAIGQMQTPMWTAGEPMPGD
jgi:acyl-CoA thioester hydrolase